MTVIDYYYEIKMII